MTYQKFRMTFFPQMTLAGEDPASEKEYKSTGYCESKWKTEISGNLKQLDTKIRDKVSSLYTSVRQAFLKLD